MSESLSDGWTSRKRLLTALDCGVPDRVPVNTYELAGYNSTDWYNRQPSYQRLMERIRADTDCITNWAPSGLDQSDAYAHSTACVLCSMHPVPTDTQTERDGKRTRTTQVLHTPAGDLRRVTEADDHVLTTWTVEHLCKSTDDVDKALSVPYEPATYSDSDYGRVQTELGDRGLVMNSPADPACIAAQLMSYQDYMMWAFEQTEHFARTVDAVAERVMDDLHRQLGVCTVDLYRICGPEYMTPPYLPPRFFKRFMVPHVRQMTDIIHSYGGKVRLHCHGKIGQVLDMFFETGCDGTDPCEPPPDGDIELDEVKRRCADHHVSVWGNIELKVLEQGSTDDVRRTVKRCMDQAKAGGGYIVLPTAGPINIPLATQTESNYLTMIDAALEYGVY